MSDQQFKAILDSLNKGKKDVLFFTRPLTAQVDLANGWMTSKYPNGRKPTYHGPGRYYLIREANFGRYIGLVADGSQFELHWYILPAFRGKGHMYAAMDNIILPHLFQDNREEQRISIDSNRLTPKNFKASNLLAKKLGFKSQSEDNGKNIYTLTPENYQSSDYFDGQLADFDQHTAESLREKVSHHFTQLKIIQSELEMKLGLTDEVLSVKDDIDSLRYCFDDLFVDGYRNKKISTDI